MDIDIEKILRRRKAKIERKKKQKELTKIYEKIRHTRRYKTWRKKVFIRDNYSCRKCSSKKDLEAHHIVSLSRCVSLVRIDLIYDVENGISYCNKCHLEEHTKLRKYLRELHIKKFKHEKTDQTLEN